MTAILLTWGVLNIHEPRMSGGAMSTSQSVMKSMMYCVRMSYHISQNVKNYLFRICFAARIRKKGWVYKSSLKMPGTLHLLETCSFDQVWMN